VKLVDLTLELHDGFQSHAAHARTTVMDFVTHAFSAPRYTAPCRGFATKLLIMSDHAGTHVDAPYHFIEGGQTIEQVAPESLYGPAVLLDVARHLPDARPATADALERLCREQGISVEAGDIALLRMWPGRWGAHGFHEAQGIHESGARWLLDRGVKAIGIDLAYFEADLIDMRRPVHMLVLGRGVPVMENLVNLDQIGRSRFTFIGLPLPIRGATGSPIRAVALLD
jgi:kynurenine formamidase